MVTCQLLQLILFQKVLKVFCAKFETVLLIFQLVGRYKCRTFYIHSKPSGYVGLVYFLDFFCELQSLAYDGVLGPD